MKNLLIFILLAILLVSCSPALTPVPTSTTMNPSLTAVTLTPLHTATLTPLPTATLPPEPTVTFTPIILGELNPYLTGIGEHGAMVCLQPDLSEQLEYVTLKANIIQAGKVVDRNIPSEQDSEYGTCFELIDAKYEFGVPVSIEIFATANNLVIENSEQTFELGNMNIYPFAYPIFRNANIGIMKLQLFNWNHSDPKYSGGQPFFAHDLFVSDENGIQQRGIPVYMIGTFKVLFSGVDDNSGIAPNPDNHRLFVELPFTGYHCFYQHLDPLSPQLAEGKTYQYDPNMVVAIIGPKDKYSGFPHLHFECQDPKTFMPDDYVWNGFNVDSKSIGLHPTGRQPVGIEIEDILLEGWIK